MEIIKRKIQYLRSRIGGTGGRADLAARFFIYLIIFALPLATISRSASLLEYDKVVFFYIALLIPVLIWLFQSYKKRQINFKWSVFDLGFGIFLLAYLAASLFGRDPWRSIVGTDANLTYSWITFAGLYVFFLLVKSYLTDIKYIKKAVKLLLISGIAVLASSLLFQLVAQTQFSLVSTSSLSLNLFVAILVMISYFLHTQSVGNGKIFPILTLLLFSLFLWYRGQTLPLLMLVIFVGALAFYQAFKVKEFNGKKMGIIAVYLLVTISFMIIPITKIIGIAPMASSDTPTAEIRLPLAAQLPIISSTLREKWLFGFGPQNYNLAYHAFKPAELNLTPWYGAEIFSSQSLASEIFIGSGLVGFLCLYGSIIYFLFICWKKKNHESQILLLALSVITLYSLFVNFELSTMMVVFLLLAISGNFLGHQKELHVNLRASYAKLFLCTGLIMLLLFAGCVIRPKLSVYYYMIKPLSTDGQNINIDNVIAGTKFAIKSAPYVSAYYSNLASALIGQYGQNQNNKVEFDKIELKDEIKNNIILAEARARQYYDYMALRSTMMSFVSSLDGENLGVMRMNTKLKELDPTNPEPLIYEAVDNYKALRAMNDMSSAEAGKLKELIEYNLNKAIKLKADEPNLYSLAADYYQYINALDKAEENARKALDLATQQKDYVLALLKVYQLEGKYQPMLDLVNLYLKDNENDLDLLKLKLAALNGLKQTTEVNEIEKLIKELEAKTK